MQGLKKAKIIYIDESYIQSSHGTNRGMVLLFVLGKLQDELNHPTFVLVGKFKHVAAVSDIKHSVSHTTQILVLLQQ